MMFIREMLSLNTAAADMYVFSAFSLNTNNKRHTYN